MNNRLLIGAAYAAMLVPQIASADPYVVVASPPSPTAGYTMGGYEYNLGGGILVQMEDGSGNVVSSSHPMPISGSFAATIGGFTPNGTYATPMVINGTSSEITLPAGTVELVTNMGTATAFVNFGTSSTITATSSATPIAPGGAFPVTLGSFTTMAAITATGTTTLNITGGAGLFTGLGGIGAGGGGGGGTVTQGPGGTNTSPWFVSPGTSTFPVSGTVTAVPTGTQAISGTATTIPSGTQAVSGTLALSGTQTVTDPNVEAAAGSASSYIFNIQQIGAANLGTGTVTCGTAATAIVTSRATRQTITIAEVGTASFFVGGVAVTTGGGMYVPAVSGASITLPSSAAISCIAPVPVVVSYIETY